MRLSMVALCACLIACTGDTTKDTPSTTGDTATATATATPTGDTAEPLTLTGDFSGSCVAQVPKKYQGKGLKKDLDIELSMDLTETAGDVTGIGTLRVTNSKKVATKNKKKKKELKEVLDFELTIQGTFDGASTAALAIDITKGKSKGVTLRYDGDLVGDAFDGTLSVIKTAKKGTPKKTKGGPAFLCTLSR